VDVAYEEEKMRVEDECRTGRMRVRERLLEGLEERRKKAREEKEGEGTNGGTCYLCFVIFLYFMLTITIKTHRWTPNLVLTSLANYATNSGPPHPQRPQASRPPTVLT
jgi:hypothetical protein